MRAWIEKRSGKDGDPSLRLRYEAPDQDGGVRLQSETLRPLPGETTVQFRQRAKARLAELQTDVRRGTFVPDDKLTVKELIDEWLATRKGDLAESSLQCYRLAGNRAIKALGSVRVQTLTTRQIQALYRKLTEQGYAPNGIRNVHKVLGGALRQAVAWGVLAKSPAIGVRVPIPEDRPPTVWTGPEMATFLRAADQDERHGALWRVAVATGMRRGELLALRWSDVDFGRSTVTVQRTLTKDADAHFIVGQTTKVKRSRRTVSLPPDTLEALKQHRVRQAERRLKLGAGWIDPDEHRVFDRGDGGMLHPDTMRQYFRRFCAAAGVPIIRIHDQRHTNATEDLAAGTNPVIVANRLGISVQQLLSTYGHALPSAHKDAAVAFEARMAAHRPVSEHDNITAINTNSGTSAPNSAPIDGEQGEKTA